MRVGVARFEPTLGALSQPERVFRDASQNRVEKNRMPTPPSVRDPRETEIVVILKGGLTSWRDLFNPAGHSSARGGGRGGTCPCKGYGVDMCDLSHKWTDLSVRVVVSVVTRLCRCSEQKSSFELLPVTISSSLNSELRPSGCPIASHWLLQSEERGPSSISGDASTRTPVKFKLYACAQNPLTSVP